MVGFLHEADRVLCWPRMVKKHSTSDQGPYTLRQRISGMNADEVKRLRQLEHENALVRMLLAERNCKIEVMKEIVAKQW